VNNYDFFMMFGFIMIFLSFILLLCAASQDLVYAMTPPFNPQMKKSYSHGYLDNRSYGSIDNQNCPICFRPEFEQPIRDGVVDNQEFIPQAILIIPTVQAVSLHEVVTVASDQYYENHDYDITSIMFSYRRHNGLMSYRHLTPCTEQEIKCAVISGLCLVGLGCIVIGR
jgi:hypothetical protein